MTLRECERCSKIEEPNDVGMLLVHYICGFCRHDSLEIGHNTGVDADIEREDDLMGL